MVADGVALAGRLGEGTFVKVLASEVGLGVMAQLKGLGVTATGIFPWAQGSSG